MADAEGELMRKNVTVAVQTAPAPIDLDAWVVLYVREVLRLEGYAIARDAPSSPQFKEAS